jgi:PPOX class probable F420-dependent enzyme
MPPPSYSPAVSMRELIKMDDDEVAAFLRSNARARVSSLNKDGSPHVVPISYVVLEGDVTFWADNDSQKVVNLRRDARVAAIVDDGLDFQELRGVQVAGVAELSVATELSERVADLFAAKAPEEHREGAKTMLLALAAERTVVRVKASRVASWDHHKLGGTARAQDLGR